MTYEILTSSEFVQWREGLRDVTAQAAIERYLDRISQGNLGYTRQVAGDIYEKKINVSGGYRLYYFVRVKHVIVMLTGGTKRTQKRDIKKAMEIRKGLYDNDIT